MTPETRPVWGTKKVRACDLMIGDVTRNSFGKWDVVSRVGDGEGPYITIGFEVGGGVSMRTVHLVDIQVVKPS